MGQVDGWPRWRKSSFSGNGDCVEWLRMEDRVQVRDSKDRSGPTLSFTHSEWLSFLEGVRNGEADLGAGS